MSEEEIEQPKLLRTMVPGRIYDRLLAHAKEGANGMGTWDFGLTIERLMDRYELTQRIEDVELRMDMLEQELLQREAEQQIEEKSEVEELGLLGPK